MSSCGPVPDIWGGSPPPDATPVGAYLPIQIQIPPATATQPAAATEALLPAIEPTITLTSTATFTPAPTNTPTFTPMPSKANIERVLIISFDGLRPDAIELAPMPSLMTLMQGGAHAPLTARTIDYPATSPSHASMLSGLCMEDHGMIYNKFFMYMGYSKGVDVFDLAHEAGLKTVMIVSKDKLRQLAEPETTDVFEVAYGEPAITRTAVAQIPEGFDLMFIHFAGGDNRGHKYGWMSEEYMKVLREGDEALGEIIKTLKDNNLFDTTLFIITSDHGGHDKNHIGLIIEDYRITWIAYGPGVIPQELTLPIYTMDTAATAAYALGLPLNPEWDGIPVYQIFGEPQLKTHERYPCKT
ncbi:MAG: ectonucleotide pyrophosphatase/phosphodiesterase [Anaerolineales bacterium]|nr:ectonucleotide pyrophosphatase/phosphodiesterase [Anaerolineales bacterium]